MSPAMGIVSTQAHTICPATPHRTADTRRVAPTPTIAPVIACVVLTPTPRYVAVKTAIAAPVSAANPPTGERAERDGGVRRQHHPDRNEELIDVARRVKDARDDPHRLLRVVGAVA